jgi:phosphoribosylformimino-5-aminoimidazole carboxamide ribotide isomerase
MIIPCIDLMDGRVVQLVQGRDKALEAESPDDTLAMFAGFPQIQIIDLDAAKGTGSNSSIVQHLANRVIARVGGGVRTVERAQQRVAQGAFRVILSTSAFSAKDLNLRFLSALNQAIGKERVTIALDSKDGYIVIKGWQESTRFTAKDVIPELQSYCSGFLCTNVDKEGMMGGTDLAWFESLRRLTGHELIAAGGITTRGEIQALTQMNIHCAIGMAIYTGRLDLEELKEMQSVIA